MIIITYFIEENIIMTTHNKQTDMSKKKNKEPYRAQPNQTWIISLAVTTTLIQTACMRASNPDRTFISSDTFQAV